MGAVLFLALVLGLLFYWDLKIKFLMVFNLRAGRNYLDRRANEMARQLFVNARVYGGLNLAIDNTSERSLPDRFLIISNHQSLVDIPFLMVVFRRYKLRFVAKKNLGRWFPAASAVLRYQHHALIDRGAGFSGTFRELRRLGAESRGDKIPVVFPEGTRSKSGKVNVFHEGAVRTMMQAHSLPVVTVAVDGGYRFSRLRQVVQHLKGSTYRGRILSVHPAPATKAEISALVDTARREIVAQITEWREGSRSTVSTSK